MDPIIPAGRAASALTRWALARLAKSREQATAVYVTSPDLLPHHDCTDGPHGHVGPCSVYNDGPRIHDVELVLHGAHDGEVTVRRGTLSPRDRMVVDWNGHRFLADDTVSVEIFYTTACGIRWSRRPGAGPRRWHEQEPRISRLRALFRRRAIAGM